MSEDDAANIQVLMVRAARVCSTASQVWKMLANEFPQYTESEIKEACRPVIERMCQNL
ncbi:hypothetical protein [Pantoea dispersa]|uniref:hypothetical protein n=1 Tax=Pantoea dispersa TaxID=59814 RepID=UPI0021C9F6B8|nr:hypothetical protein [Pantoea dispersa]